MNKDKIREAILYLRDALTPEQIEKVRTLKAKDPEWYAPYHEGIGLSITIRNLLRIGGYRERDIEIDYEKEVRIPDGSTLRCWLFILYQAVK